MRPPHATRARVLEEGIEILEKELSFMMPSQGLTTIASALGSEASTSEVASGLASELLDVLWNPLGGCESLILHLSDEDLGPKLQLFWRCAVALCMMPLQELEFMSRRKLQFLAAGTELPSSLLGHIRLNLPIFAMVAQMPEAKLPRADPSDGNEEALPPEASARLEDTGSSETTANCQAEIRTTPPKIFTAARHTYDVGYSRWESFDVDTALQEVDAVSSQAPRRLEEVKLPQASATLLVEDPLQALDAALANCRVPEAAMPVAVCPESSTARQLEKEYRRWDQFDDNDDLDSEDEIGDLDALTGPSDEVELIHSHWRREGRRQKRGGGGKREKRMQQIPALPTGPIKERPCEHRSAEDPAAAAIARDYGKWKSYDANAALLDLDNEGKTAEGDAVRCSSQKGSACLSMENYSKDREEFELDEEIEQRLGSLKRAMAQRLQDAAGLKAEGNEQLRRGDPQNAARIYEQALTAMELGDQANAMMTESLLAKQSSLIADLLRNLAASHLELADYESARRCCDEVLRRAAERGVQDEKARYRRCLASLRMGKRRDAEEDADHLEKLLGSQDLAVMRLRSELAAERGK